MLYFAEILHQNPSPKSFTKILHQNPSPKSFTKILHQNPWVIVGERDFTCSGHRPLLPLPCPYSLRPLTTPPLLSRPHHSKAETTHVCQECRGQGRVNQGHFCQGHWVTLTYFLNFFSFFPSFFARPKLSVHARATVLDVSVYKT